MMKKRDLRLRVLCAALACLFGTAGAQTPEMSFRAQDIPLFYEDVTTFASAIEGKARLIVDTGIAYDELQFVSKEEEYRAEYELSVTVFDHRGDQADGRIVKRTVLSEDYAETNLSSQLDLSRMEFLVPPGDYHVYIGMQDMESRKTGHRKVGIEVPDYDEDPMSLSSLVLANRVWEDSSGTTGYEPNVMNNFGGVQDTLFLVFEVYADKDRESVPVRVRILGMRNKSLWSKSYELALEGAKTEEVVALERGDLKSGRYRLEVTVGKRGRTVDRRREFSVQWIGMPATAVDLDKAVDQLQYLLRGSELKKMKRADEEEKEAMFKEFWASRDESPGTRKNELMEEYYRRIQYANAHFSTYREGWETDRGMVYAILGPPDDVERHPFDQGTKPFQVWAYYRFNRNFIFIDETGFGEYRLRTPSAFWQVVNELRR